MTSPEDKQRIIARVRHVEHDHRIAHLELRNGNIIPHPMDDDEVFDVGTIVLVGPSWHDIQEAPQDLWQEELWVAVVRLVLDDEVLVSINGYLKTVIRPVGLDITEGNTVQGNNTAGIIRKLADEPVRHLDISITEPINADNFKRTKGAELSFADFGGSEDIRQRACELIELPLKHHDKLQKIGARPIKGVLFTGPPGTGKTMLARIIASQADAHFYEISGPQILSKWYGQSEELIRAIFEDAARQERAIVFFDELDSLAVQRGENSHEASRRIVGQLLASMDGFSPQTNVVVIGTTNRPEDIDVALRRPGRFDWEISFTMPSLEDRRLILAASASKLNTEGDLPYGQIAEQTDSWSPAELTSIWSEAALLAVQDNRDIILSEDLYGGYERATAQRARINASRRSESKEEQN